MKRSMALFLMVVLLLSGCRKIPPAAPPAPPQAEKEETVTQQPVEQKPAVVPDEKPLTTPEEPTAMPEEKVESAPVPEPAPTPEPDWQAKAIEAYFAVTDREEFLVRVEEADGSFTELPVLQGRNDWNVAHVGQQFTEFDWSAATAADWQALESDRCMSFYVPGEISVSCTQEGDVVKITTPEKTEYLRAVNPVPNVFVSNLYSLLATVPEDAYGMSVWSAPVDGALEPEAAAAAFMESVAANYMAVPDWVSWKPLEIKESSVEVYDVYRGIPEQFCFNMKLRVKIEDPMAPEAVYWQAGAGLEEPDEDGFYGWGRQVLVEKNESGNWEMLGWGGGYSVEPVKPEGKSQAAWLVELFCLTEGFTHDQVVPYLLLELSDEEIAELPAVLDELTETEARELCAVLGDYLREADSWRWSIDLLAPLLGDYGAYLDT